jgi:predicted chitinase
MPGGLELCRDVVDDPGPATLEVEDLAVEWYWKQKGSCRPWSSSKLTA